MGAADFLEKPFTDEELLSSVLNAMHRAKRAATRKRQVLDAQRQLEPLTDRERSILDFLVESEANKVTARKPNLSPRTVEAHRAAKVDCTPIVTGTVGSHGVDAAFEALKAPETHAKILTDPSSTATEPTRM